MRDRALAPKILLPFQPFEGDDERRRYYRLTPFGRRVLAAELERLRALVRLGEERRVIAPRPA
ncbi:MAG: hypothetical protein ABJF01_16885 [bacterium]